MQNAHAEDTQVIEGVRITHAHKVYFPDNGVTKLEVAKYYQRVEDWMMPELRDRPLSLVRCPEGIAGQHFFQKHPTDSFPDYLERIQIKEKSGKHEYMSVDHLNDILYLVNLGVLEFHTWESKVKDIEHPDRIIFDLDPDPTAPWDYVIKGAKLIREILKELDLETFVKTSGGKGLHIVLPLRNKVYGWHEIKEFSRTIAEQLTIIAPDKYTIELPKAKRVGKVFIDYLRNDRGSTAVAAYSTRARKGCAVSAPIFWDEVNDKLKPDQYNIHNVFKRLGRLKEDPWHEIDAVNQNLPL